MNFLRRPFKTDHPGFNLYRSWQTNQASVLHTPGIFRGRTQTRQASLHFFARDDFPQIAKLALVLADIIHDYIGQSPKLIIVSLHPLGRFLVKESAEPLLAPCLHRLTPFYPMGSFTLRITINLVNFSFHENRRQHGGFQESG